MENIVILTDYKDVFESRYDSVPYRQGMDKQILKERFKENGFNVEFIHFYEVFNYGKLYWQGQFVIYTSSEDIGLNYKSFIEDIILFLELSGAVVIPGFKYLRANNNKVFMELLRKRMRDKYSFGLNTAGFGCIEEAECFLEKVKFPIVFKKASGAMSEGVGIGHSKQDVYRKLKKISSTTSFINDVWDLIRSIRHNGYKKESRFRKKFILQDFIPSLQGDYKVLIFSNKYFVLHRGNRPNDFRASGSGILNYQKNIPDGLLKFANEFFKDLNVPNASLDIAFNGNSFFLIEFQCLYFGTYTLTYSDFHWELNDNQFSLITERVNLENEYVKSITTFIRSM